MNQMIIHVATDGSAGSRRALDWAVDEARLRGCAIELVSAYRGDDTTTTGVARQAAERAVQDTLAVIQDRSMLPAISWHVVEGEPADVLVRESTHSALLVMGSHGVGGLRHSALGSVADLCARMAACPVVIVPPTVTERSRHEEIVSVTEPAKESPA